MLSVFLVENASNKICDLSNKVDSKFSFMNLVKAHLDCPALNCHKITYNYCIDVIYNYFRCTWKTLLHIFLETGNTNFIIFACSCKRL